jgi:hypothetical protein
MGPTPIDEEGGQDASMRILRAYLSGSGSAGLSGDTLIPAARDISHLTSSQESFAGGSRHLLNPHGLNHTMITSAREVGRHVFNAINVFDQIAGATGIALLTVKQGFSRH